MLTVYDGDHMACRSIYVSLKVNLRTVWKLCSENFLLVSVQNFGLDVQTFQHMVGDCPPDFLELAVSCCTVRYLHINSLCLSFAVVFSSGKKCMYSSPAWLLFKCILDVEQTLTWGSC